MRLKMIAIFGIIWYGLISLASAESGTALLQFLKLGAGARPAGMGDAFVGMRDSGAGGLYWNPALAGYAEKTEVMFSYANWFMDTSHNYFGGVRKFGKYNVGLNVVYFDGGDFEWRDDKPSETPQGTFSANDLAIGLTVARRVTNDISFGLTAKYLFEKIQAEEAKGYAVDLGLLYEPIIDKLAIGFSISNIGPKMKFIADEFELPMVVRAGFTYPLNRFTVMAVDFNKASDTGLRLQTGLELSIRHILTVRAGYKVNHDTEDFTAGSGIAFKNYRIDYAFVPHSDNLGDVHYFAIGIKF